LIQIAPQIRILVAVEPIDARKYAPFIDMRSSEQYEFVKPCVLPQKNLRHLLNASA